MVTLTDQTLRNTFYTTVYNLINTATSTYIATSTVIDVRGGYPDIDSITFPIITLSPINIAEDMFTIDPSHNTSTKTISFDTILYALTNKDIDKLADGVSYTLRNNPFAGAMLLNVAEADNIIFSNEDKVRSKTLTFTYLRR
jgi:hypothetical protein